MSTNMPLQPPQFKQLLTEEQHLPLILHNLQLLDIAQRHIDQAKQAGIDMSGPQQTVNEAKAKYLALKHTYFPGK